MKCTIPEISWHNREPVLSVDAFPVNCGDFYRVATGGSDTFICIWQLKIVETGAVTIDILSELTRHQKAVNVVRWSPNGDYLASGDDDANIIIWQLKTDNVPLLDGDNDYKETWIVHKILRGHKEDVYDISWSPNGSKLLTGSVDNTAILWDLNKGKNEIILTDHKGFVQGVAWDPKNEFIATLSSDRICRIFNPSGKQVRARISRGFLPVGEEHDFHSKDVKYFHDDTFKTFFRRLNFSPDGNLLIVPSGSVETEECKNAMYATYIFTLDSFKQPAVILPTPKQCSIVVRCSPVLYQLRPNVKPYIDLPYRMLIAVATDSDVILYDTQQTSPFAQMHNIHYTRLTDLTWSHDGLLLTASSTDGFITLVTFEKNELGIVYKKEESEEEVEKSIVVEEAEKKVEIVDEKEKEKIKVKRNSFIEQWAKQAPASTQKRKAEDEPMTEVKKLKNERNNAAEIEVITISDSPIKNENVLETTANTPKKKKRITPITLKSVTPKKVKRNDSQDVEIKENKAGDNHQGKHEVKKSNDQEKATALKDGKINMQEIEIKKTCEATVVKDGKINMLESEVKKTCEDHDLKFTNTEKNKTQLINKIVVSPKTPKRAQLITLRLGSEKGESKNDSTHGNIKISKDESSGSQGKVKMSEDKSCGSQGKVKMSDETLRFGPVKNDSAQGKLQISGVKTETTELQRKPQTSSVETKTTEVKPKKRATLIKIGECSKTQHQKPSEDERFYTKLIALDKTETDEVKSSDEESDGEKTSSDESDEEKSGDEVDISQKASKSSRHENKAKPVKVENKQKPVKDENKQKPVKDENKQKSVKDVNKQKSVKDENKQKSVKDENEQKSVKVESKRNLINIENEKQPVNIGEKQIKEKANKNIVDEVNTLQSKKIKNQETWNITDEKKENLELKSKNVEINTSKSLQEDASKNTKELTSMLKTAGEKTEIKSPLPVKKLHQTEKTNAPVEVLEISEDDDEEKIKSNRSPKTRDGDDKIKSPFPVKKTTPSSAVTPKQTKKTPKAEDKSNQSSSTGKNKKKQSVTPKMSLLNFFKPITSSEKGKSKKTETNEEGKMKPTSLFKENSDEEGNKNSKDDVVVLDDDDDEKSEVIKLKTSSLFKKSKNKQIPDKVVIEGVKKIASPKRRSKSKTEQPQNVIELLEEDTVPEDFTLQIEETTDAENKTNKEETNIGKLEKFNNSENLRLENASTIEENAKENKTDSEGKEGKSREDDKVRLEMVKHPRRVPLITLASPKSKKKAVDT